MSWLTRTPPDRSELGLGAVVLKARNREFELDPSARSAFTRAVARRVGDGVNSSELRRRKGGV